jgi:protein-glucosylgalactosylhydroxylysine glucosidase
LQTFPREYENAVPLCTMSQWGWHTLPLPRGLDPASLRLTEYDTHGRAVGYHTSDEGQKGLFDWLRENPHRLHLGRVGLRLLTSGGREAQAADISDIRQTLELWRGRITSSFRFGGKPVTVITTVHPDLDLLAVAIESDLTREGRLAVRLAFPYGSPGMSAADWEKSDRHRTELIGRTAHGVRLRRALDADTYFVAVEWDGRASLSREKEHDFLLTPSRDDSRLEFVAAFSPRPSIKFLPGVAETFAESAAHWRRFWAGGGAVELSGSRDPRAPELERRVVLSQYLTAIQCSGSKPPQETGLTVNSWYGKFHLEMHWWHAAHFALWDRLPLLERSLGWYNHPSMLCAMGVLPGDGVERETMRRTLFKVLKEWRWDTTWGWDYPATAMTAARLGETKLAVDALLMRTEKNRYLPSGHNWQRQNLPCYLPGNGGLLYAVALMAGGWRGAPTTHAPGFPSDGTWTVRAEGLNVSLLKNI